MQRLARPSALCLFVVASCALGGCSGTESSVADDAAVPARDAATAADATVPPDAAPPVDAGSPARDATAPGDAAQLLDATRPVEADGNIVQDANVVDAGMLDGGASIDAGPAPADAAPQTTPAPADERSATTAAMSGEGLTDCGPNGDDLCARSLLVPGGTFLRGPGTAAPATVSTFRLDKYEITVGRFRKFFAAWLGGWRPLAGAGKHAHLNGGQGLAVTGGGFEPGWLASWSDNVGRPKSSSVNPPTNNVFDEASWNQAITNCGSTIGGWTTQPGTLERNPMNCLSWYDLHAFCIWDGGFVPTDAEWEYAAAGGAEERTYAWGDTMLAPGYAVAGRTSALPVGSAWRGAGRWGHLDLSGNVREWTLDKYELDFAVPCVDCVALPTGNYRVYRSPPYDAPLNGMLVTERSAFWPAQRLSNFGGRCARQP